MVVKSSVLKSQDLTCNTGSAYVHFHLCKLETRVSGSWSGLNNACKALSEVLGTQNHSLTGPWLEILVSALKSYDKLA